MRPSGPDGEVCPGMVLDEGIILELVAPGTAEPVAPGETGEVVVTTLTAEYPLIRFATGDLSAILPRSKPRGRTNQRIRGWLGRCRPDDQSARHVRASRAGRRHYRAGTTRSCAPGSSSMQPAGSDEMTLLVESRRARRRPGADRRNGSRR